MACRFQENITILTMNFGSSDDYRVESSCAEVGAVRATLPYAYCVLGR